MQVNDRISVGRHLGTVRYVGPLPQWPGQVAYGVVWDDPARGKHDGELGGTRYFQAPARSASFVKAANSSIVPPQSFIAAVVARYAGPANADALRTALTIGSETIETRGFDKLNALHSDVSRLATVMVDRQAIRTAGHFRPLAAVRHVDLSYNLLTSWAEAAAILRRLPNAATVNLNGNRLQGAPPSPLVWPPAVRHVALSDTHVSPARLQGLDWHLVHSLDLAANGLDTHAFAAWSPPPHLRRLDVSCNRIDALAPAWLNVPHLVLAHNSLAQARGSFPHTRVLDLRHNAFASLAEVDALAAVFPNLDELRIDHCPVFDALAPDELAFQLIGRLPCGPGAIRKLNGSMLSPQEIANGELYFISQVRKNATVFTNEARWKHLLAKHGVRETPAHAEPRDAATVALSVRSSRAPETELFSRAFQLRNTVLRLKGIVAKFTGASVLDFSLYCYASNESSLYNEPRQYLDDDIATLQSLGLRQRHKIYIHTEG